MPPITQPPTSQQAATPQNFVPPKGRELRAQAVHRLQVGLFGLCSMLLIVGLANIIMDRARLAERRNPPEVAAAVGNAKVSDPLVDIGVVPAADPSAAAGTGAKSQ